MDYELFLRFALSGARLYAVDQVLACSRQHEEQKTRHDVPMYLPTVRRILSGLPPADLFALRAAMTRSLVLGVGGQDGSILAEASWWPQVVAFLALVAARPIPTRSRVHCSLTASLDLSDSAELDSCLREFQPDEVFHVAAVHGSAGFPYEEVWGKALDVNTKSLHRVLEYARLEQPTAQGLLRQFGQDLWSCPAGSCGSLHASSRAAVSTPSPRRRQDSLPPFTSRPMGSRQQWRFSSIMSRNVVPAPSLFRRSARLFPRLWSNPQHRESLQTLSFHCDWSSARDFMRMAIRAVEAGCGGEVIFASGTTWHGRDFVQELFRPARPRLCSHIEVPAQLESPGFEVDLTDTLRQIDVGPCEDIFTVCDRLISQPIP